ncbi:MAG: hypothetical protein VKN60_12075 [Cyanobacteriota bacterium]|nr:hypothetical protein [Cyanobacteriota bacterium]
MTLTFEEALDQSQALLDALDADNLTPEALQTQVTRLVASENGARGFFVTYLTSDSAGADQPGPELLRSLASAPEIVGELLVKNLAMSSAMAIFHRRQGDDSAAQGSLRVKARTQYLIQALALPNLDAKIRQLQTSLQNGAGEYGDFLTRWGYDAEQKRAIGAALADLTAVS